MCADTRAKIVFLPYDPTPSGPLDDGLAACDIGPDLRAWLFREMAQNRDPAVLGEGQRLGDEALGQGDLGHELVAVMMAAVVKWQTWTVCPYVGEDA